MYVRDLNEGDVVEIVGEDRVLGQYSTLPDKEDIVEANRCGFNIGYIRHFKGYKQKYKMVYLGPIRTSIAVAGLYKHHLFLTPEGVFGIEGYDFRFLEKVAD